MADIMSPEKRSAVMSRFRSQDTKIELQMLDLLRKAGLEPERHARDLPGTPDFVFREARLALFVDGDFWHGWRFPSWNHKLTPKWHEKIAQTRLRDQRNFAGLRRHGWCVARVWEHELKRDPSRAVQKVLERHARALSEAAAVGEV